MAQTIYQVDAFSHQPFSGNPAGVCFLPKPAPEAWMQALAQEMNLSETAFLLRQADGFNLRWFTPVKEVRFCGHATLASAHILWETGTLRPDEPARFYTLSGLLIGTRGKNHITLDFPARFQEPADPPDGLAAALGLTPRYVGKRESLYLIEAESETILRQLKPDFSWLGKLPVRSVIVTARSDTPEFDFVSRYFAPAVGINEDPVTGSAHCYLAPFWAARLKKNEMLAYQASPRGGVVQVRLAGDRVFLGGQAVTVFKGELKMEVPA